MEEESERQGRNEEGEGEYLYCFENALAIWLKLQECVRLRHHNCLVAKTGSFARSISLGFHAPYL